MQKSSAMEGATAQWPERIWVVRHGQSAGNVARDHAETNNITLIELEHRDADVPLSSLGQRQSQALGAWAEGLSKHQRPQVVLASPYVRARQTAQAVADALGGDHRLVIDERLREKEFGILDRYTSSGIVATFPELAAQRRLVGKFYFRPPGVASTQAAELERLVDQLHLQISELTEQRDLGLRRADRAEAARQHLDARLHEMLETAKSEREDWTEYVRSVENRTLGDVDRSRQEAKDLQAQLNNQARAQRAIEDQLRQELHAAQSAAISAGQAADVLRGRCEGLEKQLSSLRELPAQLEAAFKRNTPKQATPRLRPRRQSPKST